MILVLGAMQRSGSRWYFSMLNDVLAAAGWLSAREVRGRLGLESVFRPPSTHLAHLHGRKLKRLDEVSRNGQSFAVHTHRGASRRLRRLFSTGRFRAAYVCRDLRDVMVSALDRGEVMRTTGQLKGRHLFGLGPYRSFARLRTVRGATLWARWQLMPRWRAWMRCPDLLVTRYEDLLVDPLRELRRCRDVLGLDVADSRLDEIVAAWQPDRGGKRHESLVKGVAGRYREVLSPREQERCRRWLRPYLETMGYLDRGPAP